MIDRRQFVAVPLAALAIASALAIAAPGRRGGMFVVKPAAIDVGTGVGAFADNADGVIYGARGQATRYSVLAKYTRAAPAR